MKTNDTWCGVVWASFGVDRYAPGFRLRLHPGYF